MLKKTILFLPLLFISSMASCADDRVDTKNFSTQGYDKFAYHAATGCLVLVKDGHQDGQEYYDYVDAGPYWEYVLDKDSVITIRSKDGEKEFNAYSSSVSAILLNKDAKQLFLGCFDGVVQMWDLENQKSTNLRVNYRKTRPTVLALDSREQLLAVGCEKWDAKGEVQIWNLQKEKLKYNFSDLGMIQSIAFTPAADKIAASNWSNVYLLNMNDGTQLQKIKTDYYGPLDIFFDSVAKHLFITNSNQIARCQLNQNKDKLLEFEKEWLFSDPSYAKCQYTAEHAHRDVICAVAMHPTENILVSQSGIGSNSILKFWDAHNGTLFKTQNIEGEIRSMDFDNNGNLAMVVSRVPHYKKFIRLFDMAQVLAQLKVVQQSRKD